MEETFSFHLPCLRMVKENLMSMEELCYFDTKIDIKIRQKTRLLT